jgi:hypothetical protein
MFKALSSLFSAGGEGRFKKIKRKTHGKEREGRRTKT